MCRLNFHHLDKRTSIQKSASYLLSTIDPKHNPKHNPTGWMYFIQDERLATGKSIYYHKTNPILPPPPPAKQHKNPGRRQTNNIPPTHPDPLQKHARGDRQPEDADERLELREQREHPSDEVQLVAPPVIPRHGEGRIQDKVRKDQEPGGNVDRQQVLTHLDSIKSRGRDATGWGGGGGGRDTAHQQRVLLVVTAQVSLDTMQAEISLD